MRRRRAGLLVLLVASTALAQRTPTLRPTAADLSLAVQRANPTDPLRWFHGVTATQVQRDAVESGLVGIAMPRVIQFMRQLPGCQDDLTFAFTNLSAVTAKLDGEYEAGRLRQGDWTVKVDWPYEKPWYIEKRAQACATDSRDAALCGAVISPAVADYLDVRVVAGRCVVGSGIVVQAPAEAFNPARAALGTILTKVAAPPVSATQVAMIDGVVTAHNTLDPTTGAKRIALEDTATTEAQHHFLRVKDFMSDCDPAWGDGCMRWHQAQNVTWTRIWDDVLHGDWFAKEQDDIDHQITHLCAALKDDRLLVQLSCPAGRGFTGNMDRCPVTTCAAALPGLLAAR